VSFFVAGCALVFFALAGLAFDGGGRVHREEQADAVAREAARAACEQIDRNAVLGGHFELDPRYTQPAAEAYASGAGMTLTSFGSTGHVCRVSVRTTYRTELLGLIGIDTINVTGQGEAHFVYGVTKIEG
jgi:hypothetical protein